MPGCDRGSGMCVRSMSVCVQVSATVLYQRT
jgi:hypothetical protein